MKTVLWIVDVPGWAYDNRANMLCHHLPEDSYLHIVWEYPLLGLKPIKKVLPDIVVCPDPRLLSFLAGIYDGPVVLNLNAPKLFTGDMEVFHSWSAFSVSRIP